MKSNLLLFVLLALVFNVSCMNKENKDLKEENYFLLLKDKETISLNTYGNGKIKEQKTFAVSEKSIYATDQKRRVAILDTAENIITLYEIQTSKEIKLSIPYTIKPKSILLNNDNLFIGGEIDGSFGKIILIQYHIQSGKWYSLDFPKDIFCFSIDDFVENDSMLIAIDDQVSPKYLLFYRLNATDKLEFSHFRELRPSGVNEEIRQGRITSKYLGLLSNSLGMRRNVDYIAIYNDLDLVTSFSVPIELEWRDRLPKINDFLLTGDKLLFAHRENGLGILEIKDSCFKVGTNDYDPFNTEIDTDKINYVPFKNEEIIHLTLIPDDTKVILTIRNTLGKIRYEIMDAIENSKSSNPDNALNLKKDSISSDAKMDTVAIDAEKESNSMLTLKVRVIEDQGGSKFDWVKAGVLSTIKNKSKVQIPDTLLIATYSWLENLQENKVYIAYLVPFPLYSDTIFDINKWILLEGDVSKGAKRIE